MSLQVALDLPNQTTNLSLGLCDSSDALYARSLRAGYLEVPLSDYTDTWHYNQGVAFKEALAGTTARLGVAYNSKQLRLARALAFAKSVGSFRLGLDFDQSELTLAQSIASFFDFASAPTTFVIEAESFSAAFDTTPGNADGAFDYWTNVNPNVDIWTYLGSFQTGTGAAGEWLEWIRPYNLNSGTYRVEAEFSNGSGGSINADLNGVQLTFVATADWITFVSAVVAPTLVVTSATQKFRYTLLNNGVALDKITLVRTS